jgi:hypothetical protein
MGNLKEVGRVGIKALVYFEIVSVPTNSARRRDIWERICLKSGWDNE